MREARSGDRVRVHYTGTFEDGSQFDSSAGGDPIEFTIGAGEVVPGFEQAVSGMTVGEKKSTRIEADDGYGARTDQLVFTVSRSEVPPGMELAIGDHLRLGAPDGETIAAEVTAMDEESVTLDANHPLAGKTLVFDLELVEIVPSVAVGS